MTIRLNIFLQSPFVLGQGSRSPGFYFTEEALKESTFKLEDIFDPIALDELRNGTIYEIKEIMNYAIGRCFMIRSLAE
jgi:hypothetical protein